MHPKRAPQPADSHKQIRKVRVLGQQLRELIDNHNQRRERLQVGAAGCTREPLRGVVRDVGKVASLAQQLLAAMHLTRQRVIHTLHQHRLILQVGDHGAGVRQALTAKEGRATLKVHQDQVQLIRRVGGSKGNNEGPQQFRLSTACCPNAQTMRPGSTVGGLLQIQKHCLAVRGRTDRHCQALARAFAARPHRFHIRRIQPVQPQHGQHVRPTGACGFLRATIKRQQAGKVLRFHITEVIRHAKRLRTGCCVRRDCVRAHQVQSVFVHNVVRVRVDGDHAVALVRCHGCGRGGACVEGAGGG